jgi:hypothetical protein
MRRRLLLLIAVVLLPGVVLRAAADIRVVSLARDGQVLVTFTLAGGFPEEIRAAISSGLPTTFSYDVELRRSVASWFDKTIEAVTVTASVKFDNLTRHHHLSRTLDGRLEGNGRTDDEQAVVQWMTTFERLPLFSTAGLEPNGEYYVRVRARTRPRVTWFFWPWDRGFASGHAKFTFIP